MANDQEFQAVLREFLLEAGELIGDLDRLLVALEQTPTADDLMAGIFRAFHSLKGSGGMLGFAKLELVSHEAEHLLGAMRDGHLAATPEIISTLLATVDWLRHTIATIDQTGHEPGEAVDALLARLQAAHAPQLMPIADSTIEPVAEFANDEAPRPGPSDSGTAWLSAPERTIRVDVGVLDQLMTLVGELVLARNQLVQPGNIETGEQTAATQRLNQITTDLQEAVMKVRMQPISTVWSRLPRLVRDLANQLGKQIRVEIDGGDTELDRSLIEAIKDPLTHLVRNAVDHGIEPAEVRRAAGKPAVGRLSLRAFHEHSQVHIEISDDGAGIDVERVRELAVHRQLISPTLAERMGDRDVFDLLFRPSFSTASTVTTVSGRGVGLDVVRTNIERIGGTIEVESERGKGTTFLLKIPLTLAIIPSLIVSTGTERFAIPQLSVVELVRIDTETTAASLGIELIHGTPVYRLRGKLLPLLSLKRVLAGSDSPFDAGAFGDTGAIVVVQIGHRSVGLIVDAIHDTEEIVVKPLGKYLQGNPLFAGATILSDGCVALILDVAGFLQTAQWDDIADAEREKPAPAPADAIAVETVLVVEAVDGGRLAFPIAAVERLEMLPRAVVERMGGEDVVQYRDDILHLRRLAELLAERRHAPRAAADAPDDAATISVVVHAAGNRRIGFVVPRIVDIVSAPVGVKRPASRVGVQFSTVIGGRVTELLDVPALLRGDDAIR